MKDNKWLLGWVDRQGRISIGKKTKEFLDLQDGEFVYIIVESTGKNESEAKAVQEN